nr:MAG TPA: hypothetical protein [Caudoviricetes sp.]
MAENKSPYEDFLNDLKKNLEADKQKRTDLDNLMIGIGSLAEIAGITMKTFVQNGFTREEAMEVVKTMIFSTFQNMMGPK